MQTGTFYVEEPQAQDGGLIDTAPKHPPVPNLNCVQKLNLARGRQHTAHTDGHEAEIIQNELQCMLDSSFNIALDAFCHNDLEKAELIAKEVVRASPVHIAGIQMLGVIAIRKLDWAGAEAFFRASLIVNGRDVDALSNLGLTALNQGKLDAARFHFQEALDIEPQHVINLCNLSETEYLLGGLLTANSLAEQAVALDPGAPLARMQAARTARTIREHETCISHLKAAVDLMPDDTALVVSLIGAFLDAGEFEMASQTAVNRLKRVPQDTSKADLSNLWRLAGIAELNLGNLEVAQDNLLRALSYAPDDGRASHFLSAARGEAPDCAPASYVSALFDSCTDIFDTRLKDDLNYQTPQALVSMLSKLQDRFPEAPRLLDLGCGTGLMIEALLDQSETPWNNGMLCGVDLSERMLLQAASKGIYQDLRLMDVVDYLNVPPMSTPESWHLITAADLTPYLGNLEPLFAAVAQRLAAQGLFAISIEMHGDTSERANDSGFESQDWLLSANGRFSHRADYVAELAAAYGLACIQTEICHLRQDADQPVEGRLFLFEHGLQASTPSNPI